MYTEHHVIHATKHLDEKTYEPYIRVIMDIYPSQYQNDKVSVETLIERLGYDVMLTIKEYFDKKDQ